MTDDQYNIDYLDALDDEKFARVVKANLDTHAGDRRVWAGLCHPNLAERTAGCLDELIEILTAQITARRLPNTHHKAKLLNIVRTRATQVDTALQKAGRQEADLKQEAQRHRDLLRILTLAVDAHRRTCIAADIAPEPHDLQLWTTLDDLRLPGGEPRYVDGGPSLAEMVTARIWRHVEMADAGGGAA